MKMTALIIVFTAIGMVAVFALKNQEVDFDSSTEGGILFEKGTWKEVLQIAQKEDKLIFLDIYATWCRPCKLLKTKTFSNPDVGKFYNENFINIALNGEEGDGLQLMTEYQLTGYPSLLIVDKNGNIVKQTSGYQNSNELLSFGKTILK